MKARTTVASLISLLTIVHPAARPAAAQVPTFQEATGHASGERITQHHEMVHYLKRLAEMSARVTVIEQGETWEGRKILVAVVSSPENQQRLDEIRETAQRLGDPRTTGPDEAATLIPSQPAIVWLGGSIHGFELSGTEGLLRLLEHLTTRNDPATRQVLENTVVLIDPMLNPDGRDAFAHINHENIGREPNPERDDWANDFTSWQARKFRTGHYYFDTNRDWFAHTQRETQARVPTLQAWRPQVVIDAHEMSADVEFYFDPATEPYGPLFPEFAASWFVRFGNAYAAAFDSAGFEYMTRERYNYFYPGYTTSYGSYQGAVGMLYEQGSSRGLALTRADHSVRTLADAAEQQYLAAWTAVRMAAEQRETLLRDYYEAHRAAIEDGAQGIQRYFIAPEEGDPGLASEVAKLLMRNGIEVGVLSETVRLDGVRNRGGKTLGRLDFPAGTYVIEAAQPRNRLIRVLLEPDVPLPEEFLSVARARVERDQNPRFYDITAWSLPLLFNLGGYSTTDGRTLPVGALGGQVAATDGLNAEEAGYAYLFDGRQAESLAALNYLRSRGYRAAVILRPTRIDGHDVGSGTVIIRTGQNDSTVHQAVREAAARYAVEALAVATGFSEPGFPTLGSGDHVIPVRAAEVAILAEDPISGYSFGWAWYTLDRQYKISTTVLRVGSIKDRPLDRFDVLIVPSTSGEALAGALGEQGVERIKRWVREGGTLITIGEATDFASSDLELIALRSWYDTDEGKEAQRFVVPGAIFRVELDDEHWLSAGYEGELPALVTSSRIYLEPEGPPSSEKRVAGRYAANESLKLAGHAWDESLERLANSVFAYEERVDQGRVIAFAEDLNFRAYWRGANRLFLNAVVLGPSAR